MAPAPPVFSFTGLMHRKEEREEKRGKERRREEKRGKERRSEEKRGKERKGEEKRGKERRRVHIEPLSDRAFLKPSVRPHRGART